MYIGKGQGGRQHSAKEVAGKVRGKELTSVQLVNAGAEQIMNILRIIRVKFSPSKNLVSDALHTCIYYT
jgi:hypothetical protein